MQDTFGFTEHFVVRNEDGRVEHAQLAFRGSLVMLGDLQGDMHDLPHRHGSISMTAESAEQVDEVYAQAVAAGVKVIQPLTDTDYGSHAFTVEDYEGQPLASRHLRRARARTWVLETQHDPSDHHPGLPRQRRPGLDRLAAATRSVSQSA